MNSRKTLTCNLLHLPQDIFRVIFQYLSLYDLMDGEEAFLNNRPLLSHYRSSLKGFTLKEEITNQYDDEELTPWIIDHKLLVEKLELCNLRDLEMNLLNQIRSTLKTIAFSSTFSQYANPQLGHFPSLSSIRVSSSMNFMRDTLISFFSHNPQLESVDLQEMHQLSNEILPIISYYCPKIKILSLCWNNWVNDETVSLLTQQTLFPNLKSLDISYSNIRNQECLRQFILSHPLLSGLSLPNNIQYSNDFLVLYLRQVIFPSILSCNNHNDRESHSLAISSLGGCCLSNILNKRDDVVTPELFSVDILSHLYYKGSSFETLNNTVQIFASLSKFPSMIDSILQSQVIPIILNYVSSHDYILLVHLVDILFRCGIFHDYLPLLVEKYRIHPSSLLKIFRRAIEFHFTSLSTEELQIIIPIVLNELLNKRSTLTYLSMISNLLREPSSQPLIDPNTLLLSLKSIDYFSKHISEELFDCLRIFLSVNENYQQLLIESNLIPQIMKLVMTEHLIDFTKDCLLSSRYELLVDHLVDSGLFQYLLSKYSPLSNSEKNKMKTLVKLLIEFRNNKYSDIVNEMELPDDLRSKLFKKERTKTKKRTHMAKK